MEVDDPRVTDDHVHHIELGSTTLTLIGVCHDHPASIYRVRRIVSERDPDVLAVELPPLAVPLYRAFASDDEPSLRGGEMSAAIAAARTDQVVGIDGPSFSFAVNLIRRIKREEPSPRTIAEVLSNTARASRTAVRAWIGGVLAWTTSIRVELTSPVQYEVSQRDEPKVLAADEGRHIRRAQSIQEVLYPPQSLSIRDRTREAHMVRRLEGIAEDHDEVIAVIGMGHLRPIAGTLGD